MKHHNFHFKYSTIWLLAILFFVGIAQKSFSQNNKAEQQIIHVLKTQQDAWNNGNLVDFMQGYWRHDSLQFITVKGITYGWDKMLNRYQIKYPDKSAMGILKMQVVSMEKINRSCYYVIGSWQLIRSTDNPNGFFTLLFKKIKGHWLIVKDHTS